jgi:hypothetical protein
MSILIRATDILATDNKGKRVLRYSATDQSYLGEWKGENGGGIAEPRNIAEMPGGRIGVKLDL